MAVGTGGGSCCGLREAGMAAMVLRVWGGHLLWSQGRHDLYGKKVISNDSLISFLLNLNVSVLSGKNIT